MCWIYQTPAQAGKCLVCDPPGQEVLGWAAVLPLELEVWLGLEEERQQQLVVEQELVMMVEQQLLGVEQQQLMVENHLQPLQEQLWLVVVLYWLEVWRLLVALEEQCLEPNQLHQNPDYSLQEERRLAEELDQPWLYYFHHR